MNREQQHTIEYLLEENRVLKEQMRGRKLRLTEDQRRRLAAKGKQLGRRLLNRVATIVTPDTIMRWHRHLIAHEWTYAPQRAGRRGVMQEIARLVVRFARENPNWGNSRIQAELQELGHRVGRTTVSRILKAEGIKAAPDRPSSWRSFLQAHRGQVAATDFFSSEVWTPKGLITVCPLFVIDLKTRRVYVVGSTPNPGEKFMAQVARNLTDAVDGFLLPHRFLTCDRDSKFSAQFRRVPEDAGIAIVLAPHRAPNCIAYAERFVRSIKEECLGRMVLFGEGSLRRAIREYVEHDNAARCHQSLPGDAPEPRVTAPPSTGRVVGTPILGGLHHSYRRAD